MLRSFTSFRGYGIAATDGDIGKVDDLLLDDRDWVVRYLVAETGSWLLERRVILSPESMEHADWHNQVLRVNLSRKQVEDSPPIDSDEPVSRQKEKNLVAYYGWPAYWTPTAPGAGPGYVPMPGELAAAESEAGRARSEEAEEGDPHLRSVRELTRYHIQARDDEIGHVEDFIVDEREWIIRFIVADTRNWLPGKRVLLSPDWIVGVSWDTRKVRFDLPRDLIEHAPPYDPSEPVNVGYAVQIYDYFGRPQGWATESLNSS